MKIKKLLIIATMIAMLICAMTGCKNNTETIHIKTPELPDYSEYVTLGEYKNLEYSIPDIYVVTDKKIDILFYDQLKDFAETKEITDRPVKNADEILVNYTGTIDEKTFDGGSTGSDGQTIIVGNGVLTEDFEKNIIGMKLNETKDITIHFPDDYLNNELAGKTATFKTTILHINEVTYPEITDAMVSEKTAYSSVQAMRDAIKNELTEIYDESVKKYATSALINQIVANSTIKSYPDSVIENLVDTNISSINISAKNNSKYADELVKEFYGFDTLDAYKEYMTGIAKEYMSIRMILNEIARLENITISDEEFESCKTKFAKENNFDSINNVNLYYKDSDILLDDITEKIKDFVFENAICK